MIKNTWDPLDGHQVSRKAWLKNLSFPAKFLRGMATVSLQAGESGGKSRGSWNRTTLFFLGRYPKPLKILLLQ